MLRALLIDMDGTPRDSEAAHRGNVQPGRACAAGGAEDGAASGVRPRRGVSRTV